MFPISIWRGLSAVLALLVFIAGADALLVRAGATEGLRDLASSGLLIVLLLSWPWWAAQAIPLLIPRSRLIETGPKVDQARAALASLQVPGVTRPLVIIQKGKQISAITTGTRYNAIVSLSEGLIEAMSEEELRAVIAHELGHLDGGHLLMTSGFLSTMLLIKTMFGALGLPATAALLLVYLAVMRRNEFDADARAASWVGPNQMIALLMSLKVKLKEPAILDWPMMSVLSTHPGYRVRAHRIERAARAAASS